MNSETMARYYRFKAFCAIGLVEKLRLSVLIPRPSFAVAIPTLEPAQWIPTVSCQRLPCLRVTSVYIPSVNLGWIDLGATEEYYSFSCRRSAFCQHPRSTSNVFASNLPKATMRLGPNSLALRAYYARLWRRPFHLSPGFPSPPRTYPEPIIVDVGTSETQNLFPCCGQPTTKEALLFDRFPLFPTQPVPLASHSERRRRSLSATCAIAAKTG